MPLNSKGLEMPDNRSLVAVVDLRPVSMSERIHRYIRTPSLRDDLVFSDEKFEPDLYDDDDRPMSPHEERAEEYMERRKQRKAEYDKQKAEADAQKKRDEEEAFRQRVKAVKDEISADKK